MDDIKTKTQKKDMQHYNLVFWIIGPTMRDIWGNKRDEQGVSKWSLIGQAYPVDYQGNYLEPINKNSLTHKRIWAKDYARVYNQEDYTFYPRGRVNIHKGVAYVNLHSDMNMPHIIDSIIEKANISKLELELNFNDVYQGSHYDYKLE